MLLTMMFVFVVMIVEVAGEEATSTRIEERIAQHLDAPLLFVKRHPYMAAHIYDDYFEWHPGGGIYVIENPTAPPDRRRVRAIIDATTPETLGEGVYRDPDLSWDAKRIVFAFKGEAEGDTSLYEIGVDGTGLRRLTNPGVDCADRPPSQGLRGTGQHDIAPCYLPDGRIAFTSTRSAAHVMCFSSYVDLMHVMDADGANIRRLSVNNQTEFDPVVLPDGRILYGRWEYVDKSALYLQSLWVMNPDGSGETAVYGNNLAKPTAILDARPIPGTQKIVASLTPHNGQSVGAIGVIDSQQGKNSIEAIENLTPEYDKEMGQGVKFGPSDPWPLSEDAFLIANNDDRRFKHGVIEYVDRSGQRRVIHSEEGISCYSPMLIKPRPKPPVIPSVVQPGEPGRFYLQDIYRGMEGVSRGEVKRLRVIETTARTSGIPDGGRWWNQAFLVSWQGSYDVKNFLGVVPVQADGSAYFEAPVGRALYFQALDAEGRMLHSQRTLVNAAPGVTRSCVGCHIDEDNQAPPMTRHTIALAKAPSRIEPEEWGSGLLDFAQQVQPILDRHCVGCHGGEEGIAAGLDFSGGWTWTFNIAYETLIKNNLVGFLNCANEHVPGTTILRPRTIGSAAAPLTELLFNGHGGYVTGMTDTERATLLAWMDGNSNYYGSFDYTLHGTCESFKKVAQRLEAQMETRGCVACHKKRVGNDWVNLQTPRLSRILRAPLAGDQPGGLDWCRDRKARDVHGLLVNTQKRVSPDVFYPSEFPNRAPDPSGKSVTPFASVDSSGYRAMLRLIVAARDEALRSPRVDMPGAKVIKGEFRAPIQYRSEGE
ncbi:MAG: HzsA-related protein [Planctomycetota bacterium]|jgi:hypothetical protein